MCYDDNLREFILVIVVKCPILMTGNTFVIFSVRSIQRP